MFGFVNLYLLAIVIVVVNSHQYGYYAETHNKDLVKRSNSIRDFIHSMSNQQKQENEPNDGVNYKPKIQEANKDNNEEHELRTKSEVNNREPWEVMADLYNERQRNGDKYVAKYYPKYQDSGINAQAKSLRLILLNKPRKHY